MNNENLLTGKWLFIGAEEFVDDKWQETSHFVKGMCWEFDTKYLISDKYIGVITESTPETLPEKLSFGFNSDTLILEVEIFTSNKPSEYFNPQADKYYVTVPCEGRIKLSILNEVGCPPPYFRYNLQRLSVC